MAHKHFCLDFFFFLKERRTRDILIGGKNQTDINFADIGNHVVFIDTINYFQQSLATLANPMNHKELL